MDNQQEGMDAITLNTALEWPDLIVLWALELQRKVYVQMTYDDLIKIVDMMKKQREEKTKPIIVKGVQCRPEFADVFNINNERLKLRGE